MAFSDRLVPSNSHGKVKIEIRTPLYEYGGHEKEKRKNKGKRYLIPLALGAIGLLTAACIAPALANVPQPYLTVDGEKKLQIGEPQTLIITTNVKKVDVEFNGEKIPTKLFHYDKANNFFEATIPSTEINKEVNYTVKICATNYGIFGNSKTTCQEFNFSAYDLPSIKLIQFIPPNKPPEIHLKIKKYRNIIIENDKNISLVVEAKDSSGIKQVVACVDNKCKEMKNYGKDLYTQNFSLKEIFGRPGVITTKDIFNNTHSITILYPEVKPIIVRATDIYNNTNSLDISYLPLNVTRVIIEDVPFIKAKFSCAEGVDRMLLSYWGENMTAEEWEKSKWSDIERKGFIGMNVGPKKMGYKMTLYDALINGFPADCGIQFMNGGLHAILVYGYDLKEKKLYIIDPYTGPRVIPITDKPFFYEQYSEAYGKAIIEGGKNPYCWVIWKEKE